MAGGAVFIAMLFDGLDGRVARWTGTESPFGKEYDSLADMVAFGVAPAVLVYQWGVVRIGEYGARVAPVRLGHRVLLCAVRGAAPGALQHCTRPAATSVTSRVCRVPRRPPSVAAFVWFFAKWREPGLPGLVLAFAVTGYAAALMVSSFSYLSLKQIDVDKRVKYSYFGFVILPMLFADQRGSADDVVCHVRFVRHLRSGAVVSAQAAASARGCA